MKSALPLDIPPHGSVVVSFTLEVFDKEQTFDDCAVIYLDDGVSRPVELSVKGTVRAPSAAKR